MSKLLVIIEGASASSSGIKPLTDMIKTRLSSFLEDWNVVTFLPKNSEIRNAKKLIQGLSYSELLIIGKSLGAIKIKKLIEITKRFNCPLDNINIITIDGHSPFYYGEFKKTIKIDTDITIYNYYQRNSWPRGVSLSSKNKGYSINTLLSNSNHNNIIYNIHVTNKIKELLLQII